jgi:hypothetical protein
MAVPPLLGWTLHVGYTVIVLEFSMLGCSTWVWTLDPLPDSMGHGHVVVGVGGLFF